MGATRRVYIGIRDTNAIQTACILNGKRCLDAPTNAWRKEMGSRADLVVMNCVAGIHRRVMECMTSLFSLERREEISVRKEPTEPWPERASDLDQDATVQEVREKVLKRMDEEHVKYVLDHHEAMNDFWKGKSPKGGVKADGGKLRMDLIPVETEIALAEILTYGAAKYEDRNWERGISYGRVYGALRRHLARWLSGETIDEESGLPHINHALCCLTFLVTYEARRMGGEWDDLTARVPVAEAAERPTGERQTAPAPESGQPGEFVSDNAKGNVAGGIAAAGFVAPGRCSGEADLVNNPTLWYDILTNRFFCIECGCETDEKGVHK